MIDLHFELNGRPMSTLRHGAVSYCAFSGLGLQVNRPEFACRSGTGPIPPGVYYIFDRQSGGILGSLRDLLNDHNEWFALYASDGHIDDETFCQQVKRGNFRLHPKGVAGVSQGCITLEYRTEYQNLRQFLKSVTPTALPGTSLRAYGRIWVK